jgi:hypothetical protein
MAVYIIISCHAILLHSIFSNLVAYNAVILQFVLNAPFSVFRIFVVLCTRH